MSGAEGTVSKKVEVGEVGDWGWGVPQHKEKLSGHLGSELTLHCTLPRVSVTPEHQEHKDSNTSLTMEIKHQF